MITRSQMRRQLRAQGGIMSVAPREKFGLGSKFQEAKDKVFDRTRKIIPNELADVAVKAAPFVAPFYPGAAALMRGIGRFDQRGDIMDALKQGALTYGFGKVAGKVGGAESNPGFFGGQTYSKQGFMDDGIGRFFGDRRAPKSVDGVPGGGDPSMTYTKPAEGKSLIKTGTDFLSDKVPGFGKLDQIVQEKLLVGGITSGATYLYEKFLGEEPPQDEGETYEQYMARRKENVGRKMRTYMDNYFANDPEYMQLDDAGRDAFVARYNVRDGGRIGYQTGGITMANTLQQNIAANRAQAAGIQNLLNQARASAGLPTVQAPAQTTTAAPTQTTTAAPSITTSPAPAQTTTAAPSATTSSAQGIASIPRTKLSFPYESDEARFRSEGFDYSQPNTYEPGQAAPPGFKVVNMAGDTYLERLYPSKTEIQSMLSGPGSLAMTGIPDPLRLYSGLNFLQFGNLSETQMKDLAKEYEGLSQSEKDMLEKQALQQSSPIAPMVAPFEKYGITPDQYANMSPDDQAAVMRRVDRDMGIYTELGQPLYGVPDDKVDDYGITFSKGGRVGFEEGGTNFMKWLKANYGLEVKDLDVNLYSRLSREFNNENPDPEETGRKKNAAGGIMGMPMGEPRVNKGGITELDYRAKGGFVPVGIKEKADDVPAMLSKNEFVFTADAVRGAGNGSIEKGAQKMYDTMKNLERRVT